MAKKGVPVYYGRKVIGSKDNDNKIIFVTTNFGPMIMTRKQFYDYMDDLFFIRQEQEYFKINFGETYLGNIA